MSVKRAIRTALLFTIALTLAGWPSTELRSFVSASLCRVVNPMLAELQFGSGGHAHLTTAAVTGVRGPGDAVSADAALNLTVQHHPQQLTVGISLRRDFYLPLAIFMVAVAVAPVPRRRRCVALLLGLPVAFYVCFAGLFVTISWLFAHHAPTVMPLSPRALTWLDTIVSMLLMPSTPRFFVPLAIAGLTLIALGTVRPSDEA
jgi:hypothetical protein